MGKGGHSRSWWGRTVRIAEPKPIKSAIVNLDIIIEENTEMA